MNKPLLTKKGKIAKRPEMLGNKFAVGNTGGRIPETSDKELEALGAEMIKEIKDHPDWLFLQEFAIHKDMAPMVLFSFRVRLVFAQYYDQAKSILGARIMKGAGKQNAKGQLVGLHPSLANRFLNTYFADVKSTEKEMKKEDVENAQKVISILYKGTMDVKDTPSS